MLTIEDRATGTLLGLACGDALGGPVEFTSREAIAAEWPDGVRDFIGGGWLKLRPGEITDDTQMTLDLARSLARGGDLDMDDLAARFSAWNASGPKDVGNTTRAALNLVADGVPWDEAGERVKTSAAAGNGSVMRCAPVAIRWSHDPAGLVKASIDTSRVTHADDRCTWGTVAVNQGIAHLLQGGSIDDVVDAALRGIEQPDVIDAVRGAAGADPATLKSGGFVLDSVRVAYWALQNHPDAEEAIIAAVNLGADADTSGAVAGALAGAAWGASSLPARWIDLLEPREELASLALRLLDLSRGGTA